MTDVVVPPARRRSDPPPEEPHPAVDTAHEQQSAGGPASDGATWRHPSRWSPTMVAIACSVLYLPFIGFGYGTDIDIANIMRSGESLFAGEYRYSRPPGALPYEALVGALAPTFGSVAVNLCSALIGTLALVLLGRLVADEIDARAGRVAVLLLGTQPWFWVASTSLGDYVFALGFLLAGITAARADRRILAGVAFAVGVGFRSGTVLLVAAWLLAELLTPDVGSDPQARRARWRALLTTGIVTAGVGALLFLPSWLSAGKTSRFLINEFETTGLVTMVGRWGIKNVAFLGLATLGAVVVHHRALRDALSRWRTSALVRFAVLGALVAELLFLRFPWKPVHLLPVALGLAVLVAASRRSSTLVVATFLAANLFGAGVGITLAEPDVADRATTGKLHIGLTRGVVWNDLDCRLDPPYEGDWPDLDGPAADFAAIDVFTCQARSWRADPQP